MLTPCLVLATDGVIGPGREGDVLALFAPYRLGDEVAAGWRLGGVNIEARRVVATLSPPEGEAATLTLELADRPDARARSASFALMRGGAAEGAAALDALERAVREHDHGGIAATPAASSRHDADATAPPETFVIVREPVERRDRAIVVATLVIAFVLASFVSLLPSRRRKRR